MPEIRKGNQPTDGGHLIIENEDYADFITKEPKAKKYIKRLIGAEEFINNIVPKCSIISVGKNNRYGHPNKEVLSILENSKIYRTDQDGSFMFKIKNNKLKIETCSP